NAPIKYESDISSSKSQEVISYASLEEPKSNILKERWNDDINKIIDSYSLPAHQGPNSLMVQLDNLLEEIQALELEYLDKTNKPVSKISDANHKEENNKTDTHHTSNAFSTDQNKGFQENLAVKNPKKRLPESVNSSYNSEVCKFLKSKGVYKIFNEFQPHDESFDEIPDLKYTNHDKLNREFKHEAQVQISTSSQNNQALSLKSEHNNISIEQIFISGSNDSSDFNEQTKKPQEEGKIKVKSEQYKNGEQLSKLTQNKLCEIKVDALSKDPINDYKNFKDSIADLVTENDKSEGYLLTITEGSDLEGIIISNMKQNKRSKINLTNMSRNRNKSIPEIFHQNKRPKNKTLVQESKLKIKRSNSKTHQRTDISSSLRDTIGKQDDYCEYMNLDITKNKLYSTSYKLSAQQFLLQIEEFKRIYELFKRGITPSRVKHMIESMDLILLAFDNNLPLPFKKLYKALIQLNNRQLNEKHPRILRKLLDNCANIRFNGTVFIKNP
ncbi:5261_t:CDS:2, partial [Racocetra fulgida]